jgi:hypothetical protein
MTLAARPRWRDILFLASGMSVVACAAFAWPLVSTAVTQAPPVSRESLARDPQRVPPAVEARAERARAEIATLRDHAWAGEYYEGDGLGANIRLVVAPRTGVAATWHGCLGLYASGEGGVIEHPDGHLTFDFGPRHADELEFARDVLPVRWGSRRYLVSTDELVRFASEINLGFEPRPFMQGTFALVEGDEHRGVSGLPDLPPAALAVIRTQPLAVKVAAVEALPADEAGRREFCRSRYRLTLDHGSDAGLVPGQRLRLAAEKGFETVDLDSVEPTRSFATFEVLDFECDGHEIAPERGWTFDTGAYDPVAAARAIAEATRDANGR